MEVNNKAMREALETVYRIAYTAKNDFDVFAGIERIRRISGAALSAPLRNCDRLSADQCKKIFISEMEIYLSQEATDRDRDIARRTAYGVIDALFAPYTEQKGEADGSK